MILVPQKIVTDKLMLDSQDFYRNELLSFVQEDLIKNTLNCYKSIDTTKRTHQKISMKNWIKIRTYQQYAIIPEIAYCFFELTLTFIEEPVNPYTVGTRRVGIYRRKHIKLIKRTIVKGIFQFTTLEYPLIPAYIISI